MCLPVMCIGITDPDLQGISGELGVGLEEPWRGVECAGTHT